ncbi:MAG: MFS transporter [Pseudonocardiales bacterium]
MPDLSRLLPEPGPGRLLAWSTFADSIGFGLWVTGSAIFFTRSVGLSAGQVGVGLSIAGFLGFAASVPFGHLADRRGAREVAVALAVLNAVLFAGFALVHSFPAFVVAVSLVAVVGSGSHAVRNALLAGVMGSGSRVRTRAYLRSVLNVGISLGAVLAGLALRADTRSAYLALVFGQAASFLVVAVITLRLPHVPPSPSAQEGGRRWLALRDLPFLAVTGLSGALVVNSSILMIALPLWVVQRTSAPRSTVAALFLLNTVLAVLFQVRASRGAEVVAGAARVGRWSAFATAAACVIYASARGLPAGFAIAVLLSGTVVLTVGELWQSASSWGLGYELAAPQAQGQYQGVFALGFGAQETAGPAFVTLLAIGWGLTGWLVIAAVVLAAGFALPPVAAWAARTREAYWPAVSS